MTRPLSLEGYCLSLSRRLPRWRQAFDDYRIIYKLFDDLSVALISIIMKEIIDDATIGALWLWPWARSSSCGDRAVASPNGSRRRRFIAMAKTCDSRIATRRRWHRLLTRTYRRRRYLAMPRREI